MALTAHDAEEGTRQLIGAVLDAAETANAAGAAWREDRTPDNADATIDALNRLRNRQSELIAALTEQVRQAIQ